MEFSNAGMLIGSVVMKNTIETIVATPIVKSDSFMLSKGLTPATIARATANNVQVRLYSTNHTFIESDTVDFYYVAMLRS